MPYTVEVDTMLPNGRIERSHRTLVCSITAALRVADSNAPAPLNPAVRTRLRRNHGGQARVGRVQIAIGCAA